MPELPEVEVVKRSLVDKLQNSIVKAVKINDGRLRYSCLLYTSPSPRDRG